MKTSRLFISALIGMAALTGCQPAVKTNNVCNDTCTCPATTEEVPVALLTDTPVITAPPAELKLDPFYKKYMNVNGIHVVSSWRVPDSCFYAAYISIKAVSYTHLTLPTN